MGDALSVMAPPAPEPVDCSSYTIIYEERYCVGDVCTPQVEYDRDTYTYCTGGGGGGTGGGGGGIQYTQHDEPEPEKSSSNNDWDNHHIVDDLLKKCAKDVMNEQLIPCLLRLYMM